MCLRENVGGDPPVTFAFATVESGVTAKGVCWENVHRIHWENSAPRMRHRAMQWLKGVGGVDLGCGLERIVPGCLSVDSGVSYGDRTDADDTGDICDLRGYEDGRFDWVYSSNALEHTGDPRAALKEWTRVLKVGGVMFLYLPWPDRAPSNAAGNVFMAGHLWDPSPSVVRMMTPGIDWLEVDRDVDVWGCFVMAGCKRG